MSFGKPFVKSDALATLRPLFEEDEFLSTLGQIVQIDLILDANVILSDLRWLVSKRKSADAKPKLLEVLQAKTVKAFAPSFLHEEIQKNIRVIAEREKLSLDDLDAHWSTYKALISFIDSGGPEDGHQDPKDVPYLRLQTDINALIYSKDYDIQQMGGRVIDMYFIESLCTYSREAAIEYTLKMGGVTTIRITSGLLIAAAQFLNSLVSHGRKVPEWVWLALLTLTVAAIAHPRIRTSILNSIGTMSEKTKKFGTELFDNLTPLVIEHERAKSAATEALSLVRKGKV